MKRLLSYRYTEDDDAFYDRALANYPDHAPAKPRRATTWAGQVRIVTADGEVSYQDPHTQEEVNAIVKQGRDRPRPLTHDETELVAKNRREARADLAAMEQWYQDQIKEPIKSKHVLEIVRGGPEDEILYGLEFGEELWKPVVW